MPTIISRWFHTTRHLLPQQIFYRIFYPIKKAVFRPSECTQDDFRHAETFELIIFPVFEYQRHHYNHENDYFTFLSLPHHFAGGIDWNFPGKGKLWTYQLNYFDWLHDDKASLAYKTNTILDFISKEKYIKYGMDSYPLSIRIINWIMFSSKYNYKMSAFIQSLYRQCCRLYSFPEYHIMGNHLLENGFALLFAACYFNRPGMYQKATCILTQQLEEQILPDGAHFERSPTYHLLVLQRILESIILLKNTNRFPEMNFLLLLEKKAAHLLGWINEFKFSNNTYALFGDSSKEMAASIQEIKSLAQKLDIPKYESVLNESGYRKITGMNYELIFNCGHIMSTYQPGHSHADTFSFCLNINDRPVIVDTGISTYENTIRRHYERSTAAHNTICFDKKNSSNTWKSFRIGKRAKTTIISETADSITVSHNGYPVNHERTITWDSDSITISDTIKHTKCSVQSYLHFHPDVLIKQYEDFWALDDSGEIDIHTGSISYCEQYNYNAAFNSSHKAWRIASEITHQHKIVIYPNGKTDRHNSRDKAQLYKNSSDSGGITEKNKPGFGHIIQAYPYRPAL